MFIFYDCQFVTELVKLACTNRITRSGCLVLNKFSPRTNLCILDSLNWFVFFNLSNWLFFLLLLWFSNLDQRMRLWLQFIFTSSAQVIIFSNRALVSNSDDGLGRAACASNLAMNNVARLARHSLAEVFIQEAFAFFSALKLDFLGDSFFEFFEIERYEIRRVSWFFCLLLKLFWLLLFLDLFKLFVVDWILLVRLGCGVLIDRHLSTLDAFFNLLDHIFSNLQILFVLIHRFLGLFRRLRHFTDLGFNP